MKLWIKIIAGGIPGAAAFLLLAILFLRRRPNRQRHLISPQASGQLCETAAKSELDSLFPSINNLHLSFKPGGAIKNSLRFHHLHHHHKAPPRPASPPPSPPQPSPFRWDEHPRLITEAAENGWPRFAFSVSGPSPPRFPAQDGGGPRDTPESSWEMPAGSPELMQMVRLNPESSTTAGNPPLSCLRASLPLPGPALGGDSFPQESYFEITILFLQPSAAAAINSSFNNPTSPAEHGVSGKLSVVSVGLTSSASLPSHSVPGTYPGSIGFRSDGSLYLDGRKLAFESEKAEWGGVNRVIGCGFEPRRKKVTFTVDSRMAHAISCSSEGYRSPLYPVVAAEAAAEAVLLVNLGQAPFKYAPANAVRAPNPCFLRLRDEGSTELFSVARMETEWDHEHGKSNSSGSSKKSKGASNDVFDDESELFEIVLQG